MIGLHTVKNGLSLWRSRSGNVSMLFAMLIIPVVGTIGLAIDYGMEVKARSEMQHALDAAVLSGMASLNNGGDLAQIVSSRANIMLASNNVHPEVSVSVDPANGTVTARVNAKIGTLFLGLFGHDYANVSATSTAIVGSGGPMEVAIAFDTTGSMAGAKLAAAQQAASDLTDLLFKQAGTSTPNPNVKVGLVPFTYYVNVGLANRNASWITNSADVSDPNANCTWPQLAVPATGTYLCNDGQTCNYTDYNDYNQPKTCQVVTRAWEGCVASQNDPLDADVALTAGNPVPGVHPEIGYWGGECPAEMIRLTNDPASVKAAIGTLSAYGETYVAPGLLWAWRLVSPDVAGPFHDGAPLASTKKRIILMTDGANTHSANYAGGDHSWQDTAAADSKTRQTCDRIKAAGIEIYAIAFEVTDPAAQSLLSQCASGPPYYYNATTVADLSAAFRKIGHDLTAMRLVK